jgi:capsular exopolysaccharide synthesis family protein
VRVAREIVDRIKEQITALEEDRTSGSKGEDAEFVVSVIAAANTRYLTSLQKQSELERLAEEQRVLAEETTIKQAEFAVLDADRKRTERLCDVLDTRIKELTVAENTGALNISVLEFAKVEDKPYKPRRAQILALALAAGLMLGAGLALLRDWLDVRLRTSEEVSAALGAPVLGVVPHLSARRRRKGLARLVEFDPGSHAAEAFRTIRTAVYFGFPDGQARSLVITSPDAGDGKTTVASNLAIAMAQAGQRTVLVEADLRKPRHDGIFILKPGPGLSGVLTGEAPALQAVRKSGVDRLDVLPCGLVPSNPSELLNSEAFARTIRELAGAYDRVIIDAPPLGPVADARIVSALADATLLVLRADRSTRKGAEQAREGLLAVGGTILGAVVNDVQHRNSSYHEYGYYGNYKYYGYSNDEGNGRGGGSRSSAQMTANDLRLPSE